MPSKNQQVAISNKDILIPVMGPTGAGKSYFINTVLQRRAMSVGNNLDSCTAELDFGRIEDLKKLGCSTLKDKDMRIVLIDTPGFDDTNVDDYEILEKIATWLKKSYKNGAKMGGVIYLQDITNDRFSGTARKNLKLFQDLCGDDALKNVVLATTKWSRMTEDSERHQHQLESKYWKPLIDKGAQVGRFDQGFDSARSIIQLIISSGEKREISKLILQVQDELVSQKRIIPETQAANTLREDLQRALDLQKKLVRSSGPPTSEEERADLREAHHLVQNLLRQMRELKIPFRRKLKKFLPFL